MIIGLLIIAFVLLSALCFAVSGLLGEKRKDLKEVLRSTGTTIFAVGVVGIGLQISIERGFEQNINEAKQKMIDEFVDVRSKFTELFVRHAGIADQVVEHVAGTDFVYKNYTERVAMQDSLGYLIGKIKTTWEIENISNSRKPFDCDIDYSDIEFEDGVQDLIFEVKNTNPDTLIKTWIGSPKNKFVGKMVFDIDSKQIVEVSTTSRIKLKTDHDYFLYLRYPSTGLKLELTLPDSFIVSANFLHPDRKNPELCTYASDPFLDGLIEHVAEIKTGTLPYQGIFMQWAPK